MPILQGDWENTYIESLLSGDGAVIGKYETLDFFSTLLEKRSGTAELLLYRLISRLESTAEIVELLSILHGSVWEDFGPRVFARISDPDALLQEYPHLAGFVDRILTDSSGSTNYVLSAWHLIGDKDRLLQVCSPTWTSRVHSFPDIFEGYKHERLTVEVIKSFIKFFETIDVRIYSLAIVSFELASKWAETLHEVLAIPYLNIVPRPARRKTEQETLAPAPTWAPYWQVRLRPHGWQVDEVHTGVLLRGLGTLGIYDVLAVLLSLGGLLRDGIMSIPAHGEQVRAFTITHPVWGFKDKQYAAVGTNYRASDIRALALGFLEDLPVTDRVSIFKSRLATNLVAMNWNRRSSASIVTLRDGLYKDLVHATRLFGSCQFEKVIQFVEDSAHRDEPALQNLLSESNAAIDMLTEAQQPETREAGTSIAVKHPQKILCVTHASVPYQTGGYAIRAHGILSHLRRHGVDITAVTRPGFPDGPLTEDVIETVDNVEYMRLSSTNINRAQGEIQHMQSYIEIFETLFAEQQVGKIHVRSTFLIALPALIAARRLGLPILYEVSGLWELVYCDREHSSHLFKRSRFAELAETVTMRNVDRLVVMNQAVRQIAVERGVQERHVAVAPNAVDVRRFTPQTVNTSEINTIGYLGSFVDYEGLDLLIDTVKIFKKMQTPIRVLMVGDGGEFANIRRRVRKEGLDQLVELTGRVPHEDVLHMYRRMDILVYPRRSTNATEAITPLKPFEALALEKPIVVSSVKPLREIVGNDERGLVFQADDPNDMAKAIRRLIADPTLKLKLGRTGRQWVIENRNWDRVVEVFRDSYDKLDENSKQI